MSPERLRAGLQVQNAERRRLLDSGARRLGWKAGFGTAAALEKLGTTGPLVGFLTEATLLEGGARVEVSTWDKAVLEPEVALLLGSDLEAGADRREATAAVDAVAAAIELVDLGSAGSDAEAILAANVYHRQVLLGSFLPLGGRLALADVRVDVEDGGRLLGAGVDPSAALGDLAEILVALADLLALADEGLRAGDVVITGSAIPALVLAGGEEVRVALADSETSVRIA